MSTLLWMFAATAAFAAATRIQASRRERAYETAHPPRGEFVSVNGTRIHYTVEGSGPPLVLIHGAGGNLNEFDPLAEHLKARFTVVRFDRPGLGWSELPAPYGPVWNTAAPGPVEQAALLAEAYRTLGLGPALIMGQSFGGAVSLAWALEHPDTVAGLIPVSAASQPWDGALDPMYPMASSRLGAALVVPMTTAFSSSTSVNKVLDKVFAPQSPPVGYGDMLGVGLTMRRATFRANCRQVNTLCDQLAEMSKRYDTITVPVESIHGDADAVVPITVHAETLITQIPGATLTRLPGVGHMPHHSEAQVILDAIDRVAVRAGLQDAQP